MFNMGKGHIGRNCLRVFYRVLHRKKFLNTILCDTGVRQRKPLSPPMSKVTLNNTELTCIKLEICAFEHLNRADSNPVPNR
mmetsp:Transcript_8686/g.11290  ORF Transcript_8686/g.11290 Transcript_8686/m.11290 type:complete len:81 (+) Transcript_8686:46-288(+)